MSTKAYVEALELTNIIFVKTKVIIYIKKSIFVTMVSLRGDCFLVFGSSNALVLPSIIISDDSLHNWTVSFLGVKIDACPGSINFIINKE